MKKKEKTLQVRCDDELVTKLDMASKEYLGTRSDLVRKILELWILNTEEMRCQLDDEFGGEALG